MNLSNGCPSLSGVSPTSNTPLPNLPSLKTPLSPLKAKTWRSRFFMFASFAASGAAVGLMWAIKNYNTKEFSGGQLFANKDIGVLFRYIRHGFSYIG